VFFSFFVARSICEGDKKHGPKPNLQRQPDTIDDDSAWRNFVLKLHQKKTLRDSSKRSSFDEALANATGYKSAYFLIGSGMPLESTAFLASFFGFLFFLSFFWLLFPLPMCGAPFLDKILIGGALASP
jgi:hypothetical protein